MKVSNYHKVRNRVALLAVGLAATATTQAALVGHWTFDETSGTNAVDSSGNGFDGVVNSPEWKAGLVGDGALYFNGTDTEVSEFGTNLFSSVSSELTISFWCFGHPNAPTAMNPFSGRTGTAGVLNAHLPHTGKVYFDVYAPGVTSADRTRLSKSVTGSLYKGAWNHWVFTRNSNNGTQRIYVNGELFADEISDYDASKGDLFSPATFIEEFFIGARSDNDLDLYYRGMLDDFRVYDEELSISAISNLYAEVEDPMDYDTVFAVATASESSVIIGDSITFNGTNSIVVGNAAVASYEWDFGDGTPVKSGDVVAHTYAVTNTYDVTLTVTDDQGMESKSFLQVEVKPVPAVELDYTVWSGAAATNLPAFSTNDLAQIYYLSSSGTVGSDNNTTTDEYHERLFDGIIVSNTNNYTDVNDCVGWDAESTVTINFDLTANPLGYDITNIVTIAGWSTGSGGRANQGYEVVVTNVNDEAIVIAPATHWAPNSPTRFWTRVSLFEANGNVMASGVKSVTFNFSEDAKPGSRVYGREIDIHGYPTEATVPDVPALVFDGDSISWNANDEFVYSVQSNLNLNIESGWGTFTTVVGTPPTTTFVLPPKNEKHVFYRVIVE
ncbi:PKD domain-containing protein [Pontiellaceae bacterium B12219]|nr:PKD domain-containing protein [Pontiellaceae bacterium B12219]